MFLQDIQIAIIFIVHNSPHCHVVVKIWRANYLFTIIHHNFQKMDDKIVYQFAGKLGLSGETKVIE